MKVLRKWFRMMIRQFLFHCDGLSGADSAEMDFTNVYFILKWTSNGKSSFTLNILHPVIQKRDGKESEDSDSFSSAEYNIRSSHTSVLKIYM